MAPKHIAILAEAIAQCSERAVAPQSLFELVLSGPEVPGFPSSTTILAPYPKQLTRGPACTPSA